MIDKKWIGQQLPAAELPIDRRRLPVASTHKPTAEQMADVVVQFCLAALRGSATPR